MFAKAYEDKGLAPENLSRTEDAGTVTSYYPGILVVYQSGTLGVSTRLLTYAFLIY
jgi:NhaC family Na+:H+ antiporter